MSSRPTVMLGSAIAAFALAVVLAVGTGTAFAVVAATGPVLEAPPTSVSSSGYWLTESDGTVLPFGNAAFYGDTGQLKTSTSPGAGNSIMLTKPIVGMAATPDGHGYWLVASDGGIFSFGDAGFFGSAGAIDLTKPIVGMAATPDGGGYWIVNADNEVYAFGDTVGGLRQTSIAGMDLPSLTVSITSSADGKGYLLVDADGTVRSFGDAVAEGGLSVAPSVPIAGFAPAPPAVSTGTIGSGGSGTTSTGTQAGVGSPASGGGMSGSGGAASGTTTANPGGQLPGPRPGLPSTAPLTHDHPYRHGVVPSLAWLATQPRPAVAPHATSYSSQNLSYNGGLNGTGVTIGQPRVYLVFWGSQWGTQGTNAVGNVTFSGDPAGMAPYLQAFFEGLGTGGETWSGVMTQYCQGVPVGTQACPSSSANVGYPTGGALAGVWEDSAAPAPAEASVNQLAAEAVAGADHFGNTNQASNLEAQYVVVSPTSTAPDGFIWAGFCAWHDSTAFSGGEIAYTNLPYIPDAGASCGANYVNAGSAGALDGVSIVEGHEYAETITDQFPPYGWLDSLGYETGDKCAWIPPGSGQGAAQDISLTTGTFAVQSTWANDFDGGIGGCEVSHAIVDGSPTVSAISPTAGPSAGGTTVAITGTGFTSATAVDFGTQSASFQVISATEITAVSPPGTGQVDIAVTTPSGTSAIAAPDHFTYNHSAGDHPAESLPGFQSWQLSTPLARRDIAR